MDLRRRNLSGTNLFNVKLQGAKLEGAVLKDLQSVVGVALGKTMVQQGIRRES